MRLLVGFDGSDGGRDALELARALAEPTGTSALVVAVIPYGPLPIDFRALESDAAAEAEPLFAKAREHLAGLEVETCGFGGGSPAGVMTDLAENEEVDLVVVGSPHRGAIGRALIGSVAEGLLHGAPCAVVVAPPVAMPGVVGYTPIDPPEPERIVNEGIESVDSSPSSSCRGPSHRRPGWRRGPRTRAGGRSRGSGP